MTILNIYSIGNGSPVGKKSEMFFPGNPKTFMFQAFFTVGFNLCKAKGPLDVEGYVKG